MAYGWKSKSWLHSAENKEMQRQRRKATEQYLAAPCAVVEFPALCPCCGRFPCALGPGPIYRGQRPEDQQIIRREMALHPLAFIHRK